MIPFSYLHSDRNVRIASQVLFGAVDAGVKLATVVFGRVNCDLLTQSQPRMSKLAQVLQHVKHLQWDAGEPYWIQYGDNYDSWMDHSHDVRDLEDTFEEGRFSQFIASARMNLQTLVISTPDLGCLYHGHASTDFANVIGKLHFPQLRSFSIKRIETTLRGLKSFLLRHKDTLTDLRMCEMYMLADMGEVKEESWRDFFLAVRGGELPRLKSVCLRGGFYNVENNVETSHRRIRLRNNTGVSHQFGHGALEEYVGTPFSKAMEAFMIHGGEQVPSACEDGNPHDVDFHSRSLEVNMMRGITQHPPLEESRSSPLPWAGEAVVPVIRPIGWDISWVFSPGLSSVTLGRDVRNHLY